MLQRYFESSPVNDLYFSLVAVVETERVFYLFRYVQLPFVISSDGQRITQLFDWVKAVIKIPLECPPQVSLDCKPRENPKPFGIQA